MGLSVVRDLRERRALASPEEIADFETDVLSGFVLARAAAGLADSTIRGDVANLEQVRAWLGRPLWRWSLLMRTGTSARCCGRRRRTHDWLVRRHSRHTSVSWNCATRLRSTP